MQHSLLAEVPAKEKQVRDFLFSKTVDSVLPFRHSEKTFSCEEGFALKKQKVTVSLPLFSPWG